MRKIYCISGMGCDHRAFRRLHVDGYEFVPLPWVAYDDADTLETYARKMAVNLTEPNPILLGLSFGGMLAIEIGKLMPVELIILVSSAKTKHELPEPGKLGRYIVDKRLIPPFCFSIPNKLLMSIRGLVMFGDKINAGQPTAIDGKFMQWALKTVMNWQNTTIPPNVKHIHGTMDFVIPGRNVSADYTIKNGIHFMVFSRADEVSKVVGEILKGGV